MLVLNLVLMFRGHSKLTIGTKINIIQGFILKIWGGVVTTPSLVVRVTKKPLVGRGLMYRFQSFIMIGLTNEHFMTLTNHKSSLKGMK